MTEASKHKHFPVTELCNNAECVTPKCPFRASAKSASKVDSLDLSHTCAYYSTTGDGRYGRGRTFVYAKTEQNITFARDFK